MVSQKITVKNATGLHLKPAAVFCKEATKYKSTVTITFGNTTSNAKSVLSVLAACVKCGDEIEIVCAGSDEEEALSALIGAVRHGLGENIEEDVEEDIEEGVEEKTEENVEEKTQENIETSIEDAVRDEGADEIASASQK